MARIRTIKPDFWTSEQVMECAPLSRLMFVGMWNFCDDGGNHPASFKTLKAEVFPGDDMNSDDIRRMVGELLENGLLVEYEDSGKSYWHVTGWHHQKIEKPSFKHPPFVVKNNTNHRVDEINKDEFGEHSSNGRRIVGDRSTPEGKGREEEGKGVELTPPSLRSGGGEISTEISPADAVDNSEDEKSADTAPRLSCPYKKILALYDKRLPMCPRVVEWTETRKKHLSALWHRKAAENKWASVEEGLEYFDGYFEFVSKSKFLTGGVDGRNGKPPFIANLEWLVTPSRFANVVEGKYHA